jgi:hypothetical protein
MRVAGTREMNRAVYLSSCTGLPPVCKVAVLIMGNGVILVLLVLITPFVVYIV